MKGNGRTWDYFLAEKLGMFVREIKTMDADEYEYWKDYYKIKSVLMDLQQRTEVNRSGNS